MLKTAILSLVAVIAGLAWSSESQAADTYVRGYFRHSGTYVQPHFRSQPDGNFYNNYSTYPNVNPYTGHIGTHHFPSYTPYRYSAPSYPAWSYYGY